MTEVRRTIKCSNCTTETNFYVSTDMGVTELLIHGKCSRCGNSLQINYSVIEPQSGTAPTSQTQSSESSLPNLDQALFEPEMPSESIKELIED